VDRRIRALEEAGPLPSAEMLDRTARELADLTRADEAVRHAEEATERASARERKARSLLTDEERAPTRVPSLKTVERLDQLWTERAAERLRVDEARARLENLTDDDGRAAISIDALQGAISDLEQWLAASPVQNKPVPQSMVAGMYVAAAAGAVLSVAVHPWFAVLAAAAVAVLLTSFLMRLALGPARVQREQSEQRFMTRGVGEQPAWEQPSVDALARKLREERERVRRRDLDAGERGRTTATLDTAQARLSKLEGEFQKLKSGAAVKLEGLGLVDWAKRVTEWREAEASLAEEQGALDLARRQRDRIAGSIAGQLGLDGGAENDGAALAARREMLHERVGELEALERERKNRTAERERASKALARAREEAARAARELEVADDAELAVVEAEVTPTIDSLARVAERRDSLLEEVASITTRLEDARRRGEWDEALATREVRELELSSALDRRLDALCAVTVLEDAEREYERESRPAVLERAAQLFGRFTHQRYELLASETEGEDPRFAAQDVEAGERRELEELSDGTRMQLLLGLRIAFAEQGEGDERVPIVLDEVFSMSDPDRVKSMVDALGDLALEGRQVIYLGADPALEAAWRAIAEDCAHPAPRVVHLARVQQAIRGVNEATQLALTAGSTVPDPKTMSPEEFGRAIGVPLLLPFEDAGALHLFHLMRDDLEALSVMLKQKIDTLGKWERLVEQGGAVRAIGNEFGATVLTARCAAARALIESWHVGRGRAIGRAELEETKAVSENWYERFEAVLEDLHGSAALLLDAVEKEGSDRDPRLKGFRAHKVTALRSFLIEKGALDPRPKLSIEDQDERARAAAPDLDPVLVTSLADTLRSQLERGLPEEPEAETGPQVELSPTPPPTATLEATPPEIEV
ncbi:MAG: hypothetical protein AAFZ65_13420, partial [Planctomycetota bacterium]